jgi:hypothetical protein
MGQKRSFHAGPSRPRQAALDIPADADLPPFLPRGRSYMRDLPPGAWTVCNSDRVPWTVAAVNSSKIAISGYIDTGADRHFNRGRA